jgi:hypothetical protein
LGKLPAFPLGSHGHALRFEGQDLLPQTIHISSGHQAGNAKLIGELFNQTQDLDPDGPGTSQNRQGFQGLTPHQNG